MKFSAVLFAGVAAAAVKRQGGGVDTILAAISSISSATTSLNNGISSFAGAGDAGSLLSASQAVVSAINTGNSNVEPIGQLQLADALQLQGPTQSLGDLVTETVNNAISKKDAFTSAGLAGTVLEQLQNQQSAATTFSSTVVGKVPTEAQSIAQGLVQPILAALKKGVDAFQGSTNGPGAGGSSSEGGSTPTAVPSGSASAPVTTAAPTSAAPSPPSTPPPFTGAAMPTAAAGYGMAGLAALVAAAAL